MRPSKNRYRFEITENLATKKVHRQYFYVLNDNEAVTFFINLLHNLLPGDTVILSRWDKRYREWIFMKRGGKDRSSKTKRSQQ